VLDFDYTEKGRGQRMKLQLFERDAPVCPPCDVGSSYNLDTWNNKRQKGIDRLCHKYGRIYFLRDTQSLDAFDAKTDNFSTPLFTIPFDEKAALAAYGTRILVLPDDTSSNKERIILFDPRTGRMAKTELKIRVPHMHKTVALQGGNLLFATVDGGFHIVKRVE
jgi:hypothetical protein